MSAPNRITGTAVALRQRPRPADFFAQCVRAAVTRTAAACPRALVGIDIGFDEVPAELSPWHGGQVPLAAAMPAEATQNAQVVLFRRPLEHRANSRAELRRLVHRTLVEQLSALTGIEIDELDPTGESSDDGD